MCLVRQRAVLCRDRITGQYYVSATAPAALVPRGTEAGGSQPYGRFLPLLCTRVSAGVNAAPGEITSISLLQEHRTSYSTSSFWAACKVIGSDKDSIKHRAASATAVRTTPTFVTRVKIESRTKVAIEAHQTRIRSSARTGQHFSCWRTCGANDTLWYHSFTQTCSR